VPAISYLDRLLDERTSLTGVMEGLRARAADAGRDLEDAERSELARLQERCVDIDAMLTEHEGQMASARAFAELQSRIEADRERTTDVARRPIENRSGLVTPGQSFVDSEEFRTYPGRGQGRAVALEGLLPELEVRAPITTADLSIPPFAWSGPAQPAFTSPLIDVVGKVRVSSGTVEWVDEGPDPIAALVAEGAAKPEATVTLTPVTSSLDTLAHWVQITRQALSDASYIRSLVEGKLRRGLLRKIEADIATLLNAATLPTAVDADMTKAIRIGIGLVESAGYQPNAVALNPADYAALDVAAGDAAGAGTGVVPDRRFTFWGLRPVPVAGLTPGVAIVGDFAEGVTLFDRGVSDVFVTDSHADFFIKNILVILAETRVKSALTATAALAETAAA
jgi:HK97 family phage major capsid protein